MGRGIIPYIVAKYASLKYGDRRPDVIYAHYLDVPVYAVFSTSDKMNGFMLVGELIHIGLEHLLPADERCKRVMVSPMRVVPEAEVFLRNGNEVMICGTADAVVDNTPLELKTTRSDKRMKHPPEEWLRRASIYGWLYDSDAVLAVLNVVTGEYREHRIRRLSDDEVRWIVERWLAGEYPRRTLDGFLP